MLGIALRSGAVVGSKLGLADGVPLSLLGNELGAEEGGLVKVGK